VFIGVGWEQVKYGLKDKKLRIKEMPLGTTPKA
jgi:hypothetical protein